MGVYSYIVIGKQQRQVGSEFSSIGLWAANYGLLALAKVSGIYSKFYRETQESFK